MNVNIFEIPCKEKKIFLRLMKILQREDNQKKKRKGMKKKKESGFRAPWGVREYRWVASVSRGTMDLEGCFLLLLSYLFI